MKSIIEDYELYIRLSRIIVKDIYQYFESLNIRYSNNNNISVLILEYKIILEIIEIILNTLKTIIEIIIAKLEETKSKILRNSIFLHGEKAFKCELYEHATWLSGRTFFETEFGLVGIDYQGITDIQVKDKVVVLKNTEFPIVIRETENKQYYTIVGYVIARGFKYKEFEKLRRFQKPLRQAFYFR